MEEVFKEMEELKTTITEMKAALYGVQGKGGLQNEVEEVKKKQDVLLKTMYIGLGALAVINVLIPLFINNVIN